MAKGLKTGGRNFKPGNPGGKGRPPVPPELKAARKMNRTELELLLTEMLQLSPLELKTRKDNPKSMLELFVISIITQGINKGDHQRLDFLITQLLGRIKERLDISMRPYEDLSDDELDERIADLEKRKAIPPGAS
jgi:hypothetical protein